MVKISRYSPPRQLLLGMAIENVSHAFTNLDNLIP